MSGDAEGKEMDPDPRDPRAPRTPQTWMDMVPQQTGRGSMPRYVKHAGVILTVCGVLNGGMGILALIDDRQAVSSLLTGDASLALMGIVQLAAGVLVLARSRVGRWLGILVSAYTFAQPILFHVSPFPNPLIAWLASCIVLVDLVPFGSAFGPQVPPSGGYDEPTGNAAG